MNIYSKVFTLSCLHGSEVVQKLHPWSAISQKEQGRELASLEKGRNSVRANWAGCVVGGDTRVADGVPLGLGSWAPNRGTLVQLAVGNFQSFEPGLDRSRLKVVHRVLVVRGLVSLILSPGRFRERSQGPRTDRAPCSTP